MAVVAGNAPAGVGVMLDRGRDCNNLTILLVEV